MSYDLGVWNMEKRISKAEAKAIYLNLCNGIISGPASNKNIELFYAEITSQYPELDDTPDDDIDDCPWNASLDFSDSHVIMPIAWSRCEELTNEIMILVEKYKLICYNPQNNEVYCYNDVANKESIKNSDDRFINRIKGIFKKEN